MCLTARWKCAKMFGLDPISIAALVTAGASLLVAVRGKKVRSKETVEKHSREEIVDSDVLAQFLALSEKVNALDINLRAARRELTQALAEIEALRQRLGSKDAEIGALRVELAEKQAMIDKLRARVAVLEKALEDTE